MAEVTITRYKFKLWNFGFLGVLAMVISVLILDYTESVWISVLIVMVAWMVCASLIEKEVNNWLHNDAKVEING